MVKLEGKFSVEYRYLDGVAKGGRGKEEIEEKKWKVGGRPVTSETGSPIIG